MGRLDILFVHPNAAERIYQDLSRYYSAKVFGMEILDCEAMGFDDYQAAVVIKKLNPKVTCFVVYGQQPSASSQNMEGAVSLAERVKEMHPQTTILFIGGH